MTLFYYVVQFKLNECKGSAHIEVDFSSCFEVSFYSAYFDPGDGTWLDESQTIMRVDYIMGG